METPLILLICNKTIWNKTAPTQIRTLPAVVECDGVSGGGSLEESTWWWCSLKA